MTAVPAHVWLRDVTLPDASGRFDVVLAHGRIAWIGPPGGPLPTSVLGGVLAPDELPCAGGVVLPGLHDHHLHVVALAAARTSIPCGPPVCSDPAALARALRAAAASTVDGWVRGVGYFETVAGELDAAAIEALAPDLHAVPIRIQHRSGAAWFLNHAALERLAALGTDTPEGLERDPRGAPTGRLFRGDDWLAARVPRRPPDVASLGRELAACGVTHVTDATPQRSPADAAALHAALRQHVRTMVHPDALATEELPAHVVAVKVLLDERAPPSLDTLTAVIAAAHERGLPVAVHLTDRATTWLALTAWHDAGARRGDRIEHGAVLDLDAMSVIAALGLTVVTNPAMATERAADHARDTDPDDVDHLWRAASLLDAGIRVLGGSDAPYGPSDPWASVRAATHRTGPTGVRVGSDAPLDARRALALFRSSDAPLAVGDPADLCVLDADLATVLHEPDAARVRATIIGGHIVHLRP